MFLLCLGHGFLPLVVPSPRLRAAPPLSRSPRAASPATFVCPVSCCPRKSIIHCCVAARVGCSIADVVVVVVVFFFSFLFLSFFLLFFILSRRYAAPGAKSASSSGGGNKAAEKKAAKEARRTAEKAAQAAVLADKSV